MYQILMEQQVNFENKFSRIFDILFCFSIFINLCFISYYLDLDYYWLCDYA